jgi:leucine dehydrogenase
LKVRTRIVAGAANNVLAEAAARMTTSARQGHRCTRPTISINAGGLMQRGDKSPAATPRASRRAKRVLKIFDTIYTVLERAEREGVSPHVVADRMAEERLAQR